MAEQIKKIEEFQGRGDRWDTESGFDVVTTEQTITLAIDDFQSCCESWGYFLTEDETAQFIGAELRGVSVTDTNRSKKRIIEGYDIDVAYDDDSVIELDSGDVLFVDIETDRGVLQFVAYNAHNGYYGHEARVRSKQLEYEKSL